MSATLRSTCSARDPVLSPGPAARLDIRQHRLQPVHGARELRLRRAAFGEFIPQRADARGLAVREQREDPVGRRPLCLLLPGMLCGVCVQEQVARVDLDHVVHEQHGDDPAQVGAGRRVPGQHQRHHRQVPASLTNRICSSSSMSLLDQQRPGEPRPNPA